MTTTSPRRRPRRRDATDLPISLDRSLRNQGQQVHAALRAAILDGLLEPELKLPSSRRLAEQLGVRRNVIVSAYEHLFSDGLIEGRHGAGTYVAAQLPARRSMPPLAQFQFSQGARRPFALGFTHADAVLLRRLASSVRRRIATATTDELGYGDPRGSEHLRTRIAQHLAANRGIQCDPSCVVIVSGTQHGIRLCADALLSAGDAVWMEDPGYYAARTTLETAGMKLVPVPVDAEGLVVGSGLKSNARAKAAYVTPSHQFPTGVTMSMARRVALLEWARSTKGWIIEDDYDSEFRYSGPPLTALAGLGGDRVLYIGTFTKTLFASLRLAYLVLPPAVVERVALVRAAHDRFPPRFMQDAVADLISEGVLAAHTRRMPARYRDARDAVASSLSRAAGGALRFAVPTQGLHMLAYLPDGLSKEAAVRIREVAGVDTKLLSEARISRRGPDGFILGFSGHDIKQLTAAADRLGRAVNDHLAHFGKFIR
ncbi:MAG: PLP-dependent aminotransferase family protein [Hyphomicrobiaceae bacterium]